MADVYPEHETHESTDNTEGQEGQGHPLFPRGEHETGPDRRRIDLIQVDRLREDGTMEHCPRHFKASEIRSWQDIVDRFGGGAYRLRALCGKTYQFQGSTERREFFGPPPRPMSEDARGTKQPSTGPQGAQGAAMSSSANNPPPQPGNGWPSPNGWPPPAWPWPQPQPSSGGISPEVLALLLKAMERQERPTSTAEQSLVAVMLKSTMDMQTALMKMLMDRPQPSPLDTLKEVKPLLENTNGVAQLMQGVELAKSLHPATPPSADQSEDVIGMVTQMLTKLTTSSMQAAPSPAPAPPAPPPPPPPPPPARITDSDVVRMVHTDPSLRQRLFSDQETMRTIIADPALRQRLFDVLKAEASRKAGENASAPPPAAAAPSVGKTSPAPSGEPGTRPAVDRPETPSPERQPSAPSEPSSPAETGETFDLASMPFFDEPEVRKVIDEGRRKVLLDAISADQRRTAPPTRAAPITRVAA